MHLPSLDARATIEVIHIFQFLITLQCAPHTIAKKIIIAIIVWIVLVVGIAFLPGFYPFIPPIIAAIIATVVIFLGPRISNIILDAIFRKKPKKETISPILDLRPLPHYKGELVYSKPVTTDLGDGRKRTTIINDDKSTSPEFAFLSKSQWVSWQWGKIDNLLTFFAKFGVLRVHCVAGEAINCRASIRFRQIEQFGSSPSGSYWSSCGYLNWYSNSLEANMAQSMDVEKEKGFGFNKYLKNISENLQQGDEKDLLLFYMIKGLPSVFLCTDMNSIPAGLSLEDKSPLKFEVEVTLMAQGYTKTVWRFLVTAKWDDYVIQKM
jgi:hypothetical protein